jgi:hypothetical protein
LIHCNPFEVHSSAPFRFFGEACCTGTFEVVITE